MAKHRSGLLTHPASRTLRGAIERLHRSLFEFIAVPALIVLGFVALAEWVDWLDNHAGPARTWGALRTWLAQYVGDTQAAIGVLSAIAGSLFTVTSITFSILLLAVQQGATVLNSQIVDHYLRRGSNRAWFGFFVGVSLFVLITLVQTTHTSAPVFGVMVSTLLGAVALFALIVLIYGTIDQMRPATLVQAIVAAAETARERQLMLLDSTRSPEPGETSAGSIVRAERSGYLSRIDLAGLLRLLDEEAGLTIVILPAIGDFLTAGDPLAILRGGDVLSAGAVAGMLGMADQRDIAEDAGYSLHHLHTMGWTAISTARSDPSVGTIAIQALRDLWVAWREPPERGSGTIRLVYDDRLPLQFLDTIESLMVASTESLQHQTLALLLDTLNTMLATLPPSLVQPGSDIAVTAARLAGRHTPTRVLLAALERCATTCLRSGQYKSAEELDTARDALNRAGV